MTSLSEMTSYPPRGLSRDEAARYIGVSPSKFDEMVYAPAQADWQPGRVGPLKDRSSFL